MSKNSQLTYKLTLNERLKPVTFHGREIFPLYLRVTYNRVPTFFKSYYFDLLKPSKHNFSKPPLNEVMEAEKKVIEFVVAKIGSDPNLSLELFKKQYDYFSRDLVSVMEKDFKSYLVTFFQDEGYPVFASTIKFPDNILKCDDLLYDLKSVLKPSLFAKLLENAVEYAPPYIPIAAFARKLKDNLLGILPVFLWNNEDTKKSFRNTLTKEFPAYSYLKIFDYIEQIESQD